MDRKSVKWEAGRKPGGRGASPEGVAAWAAVTLAEAFLLVAVEPGGGGGGGGNTRPLSLPSAATPNNRSANALAFNRL